MANVTFQDTDLSTPPNATVVETETQSGSAQRQVVKVGGSGNIATNQVSVASTAGGTQIVAARTARVDVTIENSGTTDVYLGASGVTTSTGFLLKGIAGAAVTINTAAAVYGIVASSTQTVSYVETF